MTAAPRAADRNGVLRAVLPERRVDCGSCTACCTRQTCIVLPTDHPDLRRVTTNYLGHAIQALPQRANGDCVYLGEDGCTVHDKRPLACRNFSCIDYYRESVAAGKAASLRARDEIGRTVWREGKRRAKLGPEGKASWTNRP